MFLQILTGLFQKLGRPYQIPHSPLMSILTNYNASRGLNQVIIDGFYKFVKNKTFPWAAVSRGPSGEGQRLSPDGGNRP